MSIRSFALPLAGVALLLSPVAAAAQVPVQIPPATPIPAPVTATPMPAANPILGTWAWQRTEYSDGSVLQSADPSKYTVTFRPDGRAVIQADCNTGSAGYTVDGASLTLQPAAVTLVGCPPGSQDSVFLRDLSQVATFVFDGHLLVLNLRFDSGNMIFSPVTPASLTGGTWRVTGVNNGREAVVSVLPETQLTAVFGDDGRVSGDTGCNMYSGSYMVSGPNISFGPMITTRRACLSEAANTQEQAFLTALAATTTFEVQGDRLTLRDEGGATQVSMVRPAT
jgi:heat shock protein HslJ